LFGIKPEYSNCRARHEALFENRAIFKLTANDAKTVCSGCGCMAVFINDNPVEDLAYSGCCAERIVERGTYGGRITNRRLLIKLTTKGNFLQDTRPHKADSSIRTAGIGRSIQR
jgi:hypothetical protein